MTRSGVVSKVFRAALVAALGAAAACGGGVAGDQAAPFVGTWQFQSGMLTPVCTQITPPNVSLVGLSVTLTKVDDTTVSLVAGAAGCTVTFKVSGDTATANGGQTCTLDTGAQLGQQVFALTSWTLKLMNDQLSSDMAGSVLICTASGAGVLVRSSPDAGTD